MLQYHGAYLLTSDQYMLITYMCFFVQSKFGNGSSILLNIKISKAKLYPSGITVVVSLCEKVWRTQ